MRTEEEHCGSSSLHFGSIKRTYQLRCQ
uniref:Uncharacterized protein n=1 Tax=Anguilla anguilla TaxID=7936 RepID=A0A0E9XT72_ANGAN